jgi:DNA polymerase-3 subunit epsilon
MASKNCIFADDMAIVSERHLSDFAAIDFEAANGAVTSACSMGLVIVRDDAIVDRFYSLIKPVPNKYDFYTTKVHGITYKDTKNADHFPKVWAQVADKVVGLPFVAHGISFDERVLKALHKLYHIPYPNYPFYCTHLGSEQLLPDLENHKLHTVARHFGYEMKNRHNALDDAEACAVIAMHIF